MKFTLRPARLCGERIALISARSAENVSKETYSRQDAKNAQFGAILFPLRPLRLCARSSAFGCNASLSDLVLCQLAVEKFPVHRTTIFREPYNLESEFAYDFAQPERDTFVEFDLHEH